VAGVIAIVLVKSAVFVLLLSAKGLVLAAAAFVLYVFLRGPRDQE
jgi:hypothetical protein